MTDISEDNIPAPSSNAESMQNNCIDYQDMSDVCYDEPMNMEMDIHLTLTRQTDKVSYTDQPITNKTSICQPVDIASCAFSSILTSGKRPSDFEEREFKHRRLTESSQENISSLKCNADDFQDTSLNTDLSTEVKDLQNQVERLTAANSELEIQLNILRKEAKDSKDQVESLNHVVCKLV